MKKLLILFCAVLGICVSLNAETVTVTTGENSSGHSQTPLVHGSHYNFVTQQIYTATELGGSSNAGDITSVYFYYKTGSGTWCSNNRTNIKIYINTTSSSDFSTGKFIDKGEEVYSSSSFNTPSTAGWYELQLSTPFTWNGSDNIVVTFIDNSNARVSISVNKYHYVYAGTKRAIFATSGFDEQFNPNITGTTGNTIDVVANAKFTIDIASASAPSTPSDLAVSATTSTSATLSWSAVSGATSYDLQQSADGSAWTTLASGETGTSYNWTGLSVASTQYARIRAANAAGNSDWSDAVTVATDAVHSHDGITFTKWSSTNSMPLSGSYYLANDVTITGVGAKELSGDLNLCLNGHTLAFTAASGCIQIGSSETLAIYDAEGNGLITSPNGTATIQVASNGTLAIHGGNVENSGGGNPITKDGSVSFDLLENVSNTSMIVLASGVSNISIHMDRSFTSSQFNTICLPFTLYGDKLSSIFGSGYDLEEFVSSELIGEELVLNFTKVTQLDGGKPYLIKPAHNVVNPTFSGVDISALSPIDNTSDPYISFHGVFSPTELEGGNRNLLFLGANDELFWPAATGNLKGFRAYFEVKGDARKSAKRASIIRNPGSATGISNQPSEIKHHKYIKDGLLVIERDGKLYNAQGQMIK